MPELRKDPIVGRWVIIATERARRPMPQSAEPLLAPGGYCPFCEGNEDKTPNEIYSFRELDTHADQPGWRVRVVPNKFPALQIEGNLQKKRRWYLRLHEWHRGPRSHPRMPLS